MIITHRYRVKDASSGTRNALRRQARAVNFVWNFLCETDRKATSDWKAGRNVKRPSGFDLASLCRGVTKELGIHSDTVDAICRKFADARQACFPKTPRFRSYKRSLDFVPFSNFKRPAKLDGERLTVLGRAYRLWLSRTIPVDGKPKTFEFSTDARGRWYVNIQVELPEADCRNGDAVGVDLGLKDIAALSTGEKIAAPRIYRAEEKRLALFQSRGQTVRARALAAKIANRRKHFLHVATTKLVDRFARIYVGDVNAKKLMSTNMAKSVSDASWTALRTMLVYKSRMRGGLCEIVSERCSSQTCFHCGAMPEGRPRGIAGLGVRSWHCDDCGSLLDRDVNAARNILKIGSERRPPAAEIPVL